MDITNILEKKYEYQKLKLITSSKNKIVSIILFNEVAVTEESPSDLLVIPKTQHSPHVLRETFGNS